MKPRSKPLAVVPEAGRPTVDDGTVLGNAAACIRWAGIIAHRPDLAPAMSEARRRRAGDSCSGCSILGSCWARAR